MSANPAKFLPSASTLSSISRSRHLAKYVIRTNAHREAGVVVLHRSASSATSPPPSHSHHSSHASSSSTSRTTRTASTNVPFFEGARQFHHAAHPQNASLISHPSPSPVASDFAPHSPSHAHPHPSSSPSQSSKQPPLPPTGEGSLILPPSNSQSGSSIVADQSASTGSTPSSTLISNTTNSNSTDRATLFTSSESLRHSSAPLPSFFGTSLNVARRNNLVFRNGAYGIPKAPLTAKGKEKYERETSEPEHGLSIGIGEDAYFLRADSFGVADGVGGWSGHAGANPARWARKFMHHCSYELGRYDNVEDELFLQYDEIDPVEIMQRAFETTLAQCKDEGVIGSSTAMLAVLRNDELRIANMGDCCCSIIRGSEYIFRSEEQQHSFNFPFQAGTTSRDTPEKDAQRFDVKVQKDDIVILSSDGLVDNLFDEDILEEVLRFVASTPLPPTSTFASPPGNAPHPHSHRYALSRFSPQLVSEALCLRAKSVYEDQRAVTSPFQLKAMEEGIHFAGGKRDDVTVMISVVSELEASPDRR